LTGVASIVSAQPASAGTSAASRTAAARIPFSR
jgi:hypothetical protein